MTYEDKLAVLEALKAEVAGRPQFLGTWEAAASFNDRGDEEVIEPVAISSRVEAPGIDITDEEVRRLFPNAGQHIKKGECQGRKGLPAEFIDRLYKSYCRGHSLQAIGRRVGRSRQSIHEMFKRRGLKLRPDSIAKKKVAVFYKGVEYSPSKGGYLRATSGDRHFLHRAIWEEFHGPVPAAHQVYFKDGNNRNVDLQNLAIELIADRLARHRTGENQYTRHRAIAA